MKPRTLFFVFVFIFFISLLISPSISHAATTGYAWGENVGWIDFSHVSIDTSTRVFSGNAYGENIGWIVFDTASPVTTSWRPAVATPDSTPTPSSRSSSRRASPAQQAQNLAPSALTTAYLNSLTPPTFTAPSQPPVISHTAFSRALTTGSTGSDVKSLQLYLNSKGFSIASTGPGSKGNETTHFGTLTRQALAKFQKANNISPPVGFFGPITRTFITNNP